MATLTTTSGGAAPSDPDGDKRRDRRALQSLDFFVADMQAGIDGLQLGLNKNGGPPNA